MRLTIRLVGLPNAASPRPPCVHTITKQMAFNKRAELALPKSAGSFQVHGFLVRPSATSSKNDTLM